MQNQSYTNSSHGISILASPDPEKSPNRTNNKTPGSIKTITPSQNDMDSVKCMTSPTQ